MANRRKEVDREDLRQCILGAHQGVFLFPCMPSCSARHPSPPASYYKRPPSNSSIKDTHVAIRCLSFIHNTNTFFQNLLECYQKIYLLLLNQRDQAQMK
ncbi:hypothetical protein CDAR_472091 [Caerostris darwini]|uniref:Uncharacterized protein n=1 Tax=Caerostris darwini TaxID=1538125 RepID=A0AAV4VMF5_9ARAC|nr:hypothetical protein CDAR_472091 [Caerostris darwini]